MKAKRCLLAGVLAVTMLCGSLFGAAPAGLMQVRAEEASNTAQNKPVVVSVQDEDTPACTGELVVDGIIGSADSDTSRWSGGLLKAGIAGNADCWLRIDLQAEKTNVESIKVHFYKLVWSRDYLIQTSDTAADDGWEDLYNVQTDETARAGSTQNPTDEILSSSVSELKRYVRFYFKAGSLNSSAGGNKISIREIEIMGTQEGVISGEPIEASTASEALNAIGGLSVNAEDTQLAIPEVSGYDIRVYGSEADRLIGENDEDNGKISPYRIGDRRINVILQAVSKTNESDTAKKSFTVNVLGNTSQYPELFPQVSNPNPMPDVLPTIQEWYGYNGNFTLTEKTKIIVNDKADVGLFDVASEMQEDLKEICGKTLEIETGTSGSVGNIYLESQTEDTYRTGEEGYFLVNGDAGIQIYSGTKTGVLYGTVTVEQILYQDEEHANVPKGVIRDYPLYGVRGMMFDVARIPTRMQFLQDYSRILKWYKLNTMQLHLNDTQWSEPNRNSGTPEVYDKVEASHRLESELFPSLAKQYAKFELTDGIQNTNGSTKYAGDYEGRYDYYYSSYTGREGEELYYTKEEYRSLQSAAEERGITLIAELDTPGHSTPYNKYVYNNQEEVITSLVEHGYLEKDEYLDADGSVKKNFYTHNPNNFEVFAIDDASSNEEMKENAQNARIFIKALFDEYLGGVDGMEPLFTADTVHAGVDEYFDVTEANKQAFRRYMNEIYDHLGETEDGYQKEVYMWGGLKLMGGSQSVNRNIVLYMWNCRSEESLNDRLSDGFRMINVPQLYLYTTPGRYHKDMPNENYLYDNWTAEKFDSGETVDKGEPLLLGTLAALWGDANRGGTTEADLNERYVRLAAMVSEKTWGGTKEDDTFLEYEQTFDRLREGPGTQIANKIDSKTNIVLDYDFKNISDDGSTVYDASGNGYNGTITGGTVETVNQEAMLKFDGSTKIETPLQSLGYPYTMSFDVYLDGTEHNDKDSALFSGYDGRLFAEGTKDGELGINRSHYTQYFGYSLEKNAKHQITIVGTYQATKLYVDGVFKKILYAKGRDPESGGALGNETWTDKDDNFTATFVFPLNVIGENFSGYLGNIRAYNKALSIEELSAGQTAATTEVDVARNRHAYADNQNSSYSSDEMRLYPAWKATDGDGHVTGVSETSAAYESRWYSSNNDTDFLMVDLGEERTISKVVIDWEANRYAQAYQIMVSTDGENWTQAASVTGNTSALTTDSFTARKARYVKMQGVSRKSGASEYAVFEMKVYGTVDKTALAGSCQTAENLLEDNTGWESDGAKSFLFDSIVLAKAVCADVMAGQEEVDAAKEELDNAVADWNAGITQLDYAVREAEEFLSEESGYTSSSWAEFKRAYDAAVNAGADISAEDRAAILSELERAKNDLKTVPSQDLQNTMAQKISEAEARISEKDIYEAASFSKLEAALNAVKNAGTDVSAEEYTILINNLDDAVKGLVKKQAGTGNEVNNVNNVNDVKTVQLAAPSVASVKSQKTNVKVTWNAVANASAYQLYRKVGSSVAKVGSTVTATTAYDENPVGGKTISYYVVALAGSQAGYTDSAAGSAKTIQLPNATKSATAVQVKGKKAVTVKWKKVKGATSYLIYRAEGKNAFKKIAAVKKKVTYRDSKKLKKGKTYSYKIVAVSSKKYSPMKAAKKSVKIK